MDCSFSHLHSDYLLSWTTNSIEIQFTFGDDRFDLHVIAHFLNQKKVHALKTYTPSP